MSDNPYGVSLLRNPKTQTPSKDEGQSGSFTARIHDLESANRELHDELDTVRTTLEEVTVERQDLEARIRDLESELERTQSQNYSMKGDLTRTANILSNALQVLQTHQETREGRVLSRAPE